VAAAFCVPCKIAYSGYHVAVHMLHIVLMKFGDEISVADAATRPATAAVRAAGPATPFCAAAAAGGAFAGGQGGPQAPLAGQGPRAYGRREWAEYVRQHDIQNMPDIGVWYADLGILRY
jgi:hypothetical protein